MAAPEQPRLLFLLHQYDNLAGVELHTQALADGLRNRYDVAIAYPAAGQLCLRHAGTLRTFPADPPAWPVTPHRAPGTEQGFARILDAVQPDLIHIQHFLHWPLGVIDQAVAAGARVVVSFHDFYAITPLFTMQGT